MICAKEYRDEGKPDNTGGVHGEPDVFCLVEVGRNLPCFHSIDGAEENKDHVVDERHDERECGDAAGLHSAETVETLQCQAGTRRFISVRRKKPICSYRSCAFVFKP